MLFLLPVVPVSILLSALLYKRVIKNRLVQVNCWFCNEDSKVAAPQRNAWTCGCCQQYNGFNASGGYNRDIRAQRDRRLNIGSWTTQSAMKQEPQPDVTQFGCPNGLCVSCNENQTLKMRQLANFVPSKEELFDSEIDEYKRRLDKLYELCTKCKKFVKNELGSQATKYGFTTKLRQRLQKLRTAKRTKKLSSTPTKKRRRLRRASAGFVSVTCHLLNVFMSLMLCICNLHQLQSDSETEILDLNAFMPTFILEKLDLFYSLCWIGSLIGLSLQSGAIYACQARLIVVDLLSVMSWLCLCVSHSLGSDWLFSSRSDALVSLFGCTSLTCMLSVWVTVLPRKPIRRTKSKLSGCFSIVSSPGGSSQQSSLASLSPPSISPGSSFTSFRSGSVLQSPMTQRHRETTPSRELGPKLDSLSLGPVQQSSHTRGPFGSLPYGALACGVDRSPNSQSLFGSVLTPSRLNLSPRYSPPASTMRSNAMFSSARPMVPVDGSVVSSVLTSASRMHPIDHRTSIATPTMSDNKYCKVALGLALLASLGTNAAVLYFVINRN